MKCPFCAEEVMDDAAKCKHCGEWLKPEAKPTDKPGFLDDARVFGLPRQVFGTILVLVFAIIVSLLAGEDIEREITEFFQAPMGFK